MNFEKQTEKILSVKEGGLEKGIEKIRKEIESLTSMVDQIERLQKVPHGYKNLGEKVDNRELPALDQFVEYRGSYEEMQKQSENALSSAYQSIMKQLSLLRDHTGISTKEEAMKFNKDTGRQEKDE
jgi:hypothetical protein